MGFNFFGGVLLNLGIFLVNIIWTCLTLTWVKGQIPLWMIWKKKKKIWFENHFEAFCLLPVRLGKSVRTSFCKRNEKKKATKLWVKYCFKCHNSIWLQTKMGTQRRHFQLSGYLWCFFVKMVPLKIKLDALNYISLCVPPSWQQEKLPGWLRVRWCQSVSQRFVN